MVSGTETEKGFFLKSSHDEFKQEVLGLMDEPNVQDLLSTTVMFAGVTGGNQFQPLAAQTQPCQCSELN